MTASCPLAAPRLRVGEKQRPRQLLADRAAALGHAARPTFVDRGPQQAEGSRPMW